MKGRKRHLLVDTLGLPIPIYVMPADMHDTQDAHRLLIARKYFLPQLKQNLGRCGLLWQGVGRVVSGRGGS